MVAWQRNLRRGLVIPAHPLALTARRRLDERHQRALTRYYLAAGAGGVAVGVHTTQFAIRDPRHGLYRPVLQLTAEECDRHDPARARLVRVAGVIGPTRQAVREARVARDLGYHLALVSLGALARADDARLLAHLRAVAAVIPVMGFYLQPAVGGRALSYAFWRRCAEIEGVMAIKIAPFNRYQTLDVIRGVVDAGRDDIALYTGNDDSILLDLVTPFALSAEAGRTRRRVVGGLLGQWAVWTRQAVALHRESRALSRGGRIPAHWLTRAAQLTDANGAIFDAANGYRGCIAGIHEVLRHQGLLRGRWCLDPAEELSPGQGDAIRRVTRAYPGLTDDAFVAAHRDEWLG